MSNLLTCHNLYEWQTLIGSALGPFLAVIFSFLGFWTTRMLDAKKTRRENFRRIEIFVTRAMNDLYVIREQLRLLVTNLRDIANNTRAASGDTLYVLETTNFPVYRKIYLDVDASSFPVKSYFLHNFLLFVDSGIRELNETIEHLREGLDAIYKKNELLVGLREQPARQRTSYANNLEQFANAIVSFEETNLKSFLELLAQTKVYNDHLRRRDAMLFLWRQEGVNFKIFKNAAGVESFARNLNSLDRICESIKIEVAAELNAAEARLRERGI